MVKWGVCLFFGFGHVAALYGAYIFVVAQSSALAIDLFVQQQVIGMLGITIGAHRLWAHKSFKASTATRILLMLCNSMCNEGSIFWWCRDHIMHHKYSDTDADPYNSKRGLLFSHISWIFTEKHTSLLNKSKGIDFSHLLSDPVVRFQLAVDPYFRYFTCFGLPTIYGYYVYEDWMIGLFVFGFLRWIITLHSTWTVNSLAHYIGRREHSKDIKPADNLLVSLLSAGEGWHNYHHTYPYDYSCADKHALIQYNPSTILIDIMALFGLVYDRKIPKYKVDRITQSVMSDLFPHVGCRESYKLLIHDYRALRVWLFETADKIEGFSRVYKHKLIDITGDFDDFMTDLVESCKSHLPLWIILKSAVKLYQMDRITLVDTVKPFSSKLPKYSIERDKQAIAYHYDTSNEFFELFLSDNLLYTSGLFKNLGIHELNKACENKIKCALNLLEVKKGHKVLDIGCGWGGFIYECSKITDHCEGITISQKQVEFFQTRYPELAHAIKYMHYKELGALQYDRICAFQSTEHMPYTELCLFFEKIYALLKPGGSLLIEFMTTVKVAKCHPFFDRFIFPDGAQFPLVTPIEIAEKQRLVLKHITSLDEDYYLTIKNWVLNAEKNKTQMASLVGEEKYRIYLLYLKWAQFQYKSKRSRCYMCVWTK